MKAYRYLLTTGALFILASCGGEGGDGTSVDGGNSMNDSMSDSTTPSNWVSDDVCDITSTATYNNSVPVTETASLSGVITRSGTPLEGGDAVGKVYVAILDGNPVEASLTGSAPPNSIIGSALGVLDFSDPETRIEFQIDDIPVSDTTYYINVFLDDNDTFDPLDTEAKPDKGDLINLTGTAPDMICISQGAPYQMTVDLNFAMPF